MAVAAPPCTYAKANNGQTYIEPRKEGRNKERMTQVGEMVSAFQNQFCPTYSSDIKRKREIAIKIF